MKHPYGVTGPCQNCARVPATSRCTIAKAPDKLLCHQCADLWWIAIYEGRIPTIPLTGSTCRPTSSSSPALSGTQNETRLSR